RRAPPPFPTRRSSDLGEHGALDAEPLLPARQRIGRADAPQDAVDHAVAGAPAHGTGELEEREDRARRSVLVAVVEVVDVGSVERSEEHTSELQSQSNL